MEGWGSVLLMQLLLAPELALMLLALRSCFCFSNPKFVIREGCGNYSRWRVGIKQEYKINKRDPRYGIQYTDTFGSYCDVFLLLRVEIKLWKCASLFVCLQIKKAI